MTSPVRNSAKWHKQSAEELLEALVDDAILPADGWSMAERAEILATAQVHATLATIKD